MTSEAQRQGNLRRSTVMLTLAMNENFRDGDLMVTLDYRRESRPEDSLRMHRDFRNFWDKVKRRMKKLGLPPPKCIRVVEVGKKGARHHHLIMTEAPLSVLRESWTLGGIHVDPLYTDGNYRRVAEYFVKYAKTTMETENRESKKLWYPSRGLKKPKPGKEREIKSRELGEVRVPKGFYLDRDSVRRGVSLFDGHETFSYLLVRLPGWKPAKRKQRVREKRR